MPELILGNSPFSMQSRRSSSSVSSDTLKGSADGGGAGMSEGGWVRRKRRSRIPVRQPTGLYVHSSPPTVVPVHPSIVRQWLRGGEINRLQEIILKGYSLADITDRADMLHISAVFQEKKIDELHAAARIGKIENVDAVLKNEPRVNLELSRDSSGTGLLHKAVIHGHVPLQEWLLKNYPKTVEVLDKEKRNPLHYAGGNEEVWNRLVAGGADTSTVDREGYSPAFYMNHPRRLRPPAPESRRAIPQASQGIVVKPSNIRIWIHDKDLGRLQKVLWEGMGDKLKTETSSQPLVRRFLNAVPYILGSIRDVHSAAINNDVELLKSKSSDPVPKDILLSKDSNGLNALHKAAGLGHMDVARAIIDRAPEAVNSKDYLDRTPLHYAAALKDQNQMYQLLVDSNATDHLEDKKGNTPSHYRSRPQDLDGPKLLKVVPDAPRTAHIFPPSWDWRLLNDDATTDTPMVSPQVEAPPAISDAKEQEEPKNQAKERHVNDKPPEIEPSPEQPPEESPEENPEESHEDENQVEQEKSKDATEPPGISDDEGVGSEANPSVENNSTPLSDTVNEEEEISGARLGETMTLTTSLFSSKASRTEESINGTDSGNEDGDQAENRMINVENGEAESSQVQTSAQLINSLVIAENNHDLNLDEESEGVVNEEQDQQNYSGNPGDLSQEVTDEQLLGVAPRSAPHSDKNEPEPDSDEKPLPETDRSSTNNSSEQETNERDEGIIRDEETEILEKNLNNAGKQTDNQNTLSNSENININAEESAENEEGESIDGGEPQENNQNLGSTQDLNATFTKILSHGVNEPDKGDENDTNVNITNGTPFIHNQHSESVPSINSTTLQDDMIGEVRIDSSENSPNVVEVTHVSEGDDVVENQNNETAPAPEGFNGSRPSSRSEPVSVSASGSRPTSTRSRVGISSSRAGTSKNEPSQEEIDYTNIDNNGSNSLGGQLEGDKSGMEDEGSRISNEPEEGTDFGQAISYETDLVEMVDEAAMLGSQIELQKNVEISEGSQESIVAMPKEDDDQENENPPEDGQARSGPAEGGGRSELMDRPITTRSAGGSRAEILAITPAPPDEEEAMEANDQKAVKATTEEDRAAAEALVAAGDMESMAEMVLNGRGSGLLNMTSPNPDVQLFINNIPQYIAKIERVHVAAREGDLRGVQTALDRRKFAVARDNSTPLKPTPLHVAALFGRTSVLRYLAGRFPETMHAQDAGGRTALHYAATLPDNGHFYSLLVTLGADKSVIDNEGRTAEYYLRNRGDLSREELLNEYQNRPVPVDTSGLNFNRFSDKGAELIKGGYPIFNPEEGQYLADSLGEPLIKGLTEVAHVRPKNPVVHLANYLLVYHKPEEGGIKNNRLNSAKRAVTAGMENARAEVNDEYEEMENVDHLMGSGPTENEDNLVDEEVVDELEEKEDEEETLDEDNASVDNDPPEAVDPAFKPTNRDEHGQTILHFAAARSHGRNAIFQLLQEMDVNVGLRDGLYRTARDISEQMEISENVQGIDKFVVALAARGENDKLNELLLEGYDHILDAEDGGNIMDIANERENVGTVDLLQGIAAFEERREKLIRAIRFGSMRQVREIFQEAPNKRHLAVAKNQQGRCSLHVAVLAQHENIVEYIAKRFPATLHVGDNLMRAPLHYAMGVDKVEPLSRILIAAGAQRVLKDLKGRQPSYYFMSKTDIQKLQDEEVALRV